MSPVRYRHRRRDCANQFRRCPAMSTAIVLSAIRPTRQDKCRIPSPGFISSDGELTIAILQSRQPAARRVLYAMLPLLQKGTLRFSTAPVIARLSQSCDESLRFRRDVPDETNHPFPEQKEVWTSKAGASAFGRLRHFPSSIRAQRKREFVK